MKMIDFIKLMEFTLCYCQQSKNSIRASFLSLFKNRRVGFGHGFYSHDFNKVEITQAITKTGEQVEIAIYDNKGKY